MSFLNFDIILLRAFYLELVLLVISRPLNLMFVILLNLEKFIVNHLYSKHLILKYSFYFGNLFYSNWNYLMDKYIISILNQKMTLFFT